ALLKQDTWAKFLFFQVIGLKAEEDFLVNLEGFGQRAAEDVLQEAGVAVAAHLVDVPQADLEAFADVLKAVVVAQDLVVQGAGLSPLAFFLAVGGPAAEFFEFGRQSGLERGQKTGEHQGERRQAEPVPTMPRVQGTPPPGPRRLRYKTGCLKGGHTLPVSPQFKQQV